MSIYALSPLDGRYQHLLNDLSKTVSEAALIRYRIQVESLWLLHLDEILAKEAPKYQLGLSEEIKAYLQDASLEESSIMRVKELEAECNHDVKAVEYFLREKLQGMGANNQTLAFIHFALTSEDVNNSAYALMLKGLRSTHILPLMQEVQDALKTKARSYAGSAMLAFTHGQAATPTTLGKEFAVFGHRLARIREKIETLPILAKFNGAVGCYNAHCAAFPELDWPDICKRFVTEKLKVEFNPLTTQIENHDYVAELFGLLSLYNTISIGLSQDIWTYIMKEYLLLAPVAKQVGSSTMPHKINPIDFENAEGNFGLANCMAEYFVRKLPISRLQRDLSDSTVMRNIGVALGHHVLAQKSLLKGLSKIRANEEKMRTELSGQWQILAEPLQMLMRKEGIVDAYEQLKDLTRGEQVDEGMLQDFIVKSKLSPDLLKSLRPETYLGKAQALALGYANLS